MEAFNVFCHRAGTGCQADLQRLALDQIVRHQNRLDSADPCTTYRGCRYMGHQRPAWRGRGTDVE